MGAEFEAPCYVSVVDFGSRADKAKTNKELEKELEKAKAAQDFLRCAEIRDELKTRKFSRKNS